MSRRRWKDDNLSNDGEDSKEGEDSKTKVYTALCVLTSADVNGELFDFEADVKAKLNAVDNLQLMQQTPIRVLHR